MEEHKDHMPPLVVSRNESGPDVNDEKIQEKQRKSIMDASDDVHKNIKHSILSSEAPPQNFRGLYNLAGLTLIIMKLRLVVENVLKYGLLIGLPDADFQTWPRTWPCLTCTVVVSTMFPTFSYLIEVVAANRIMDSRTIRWMHFVFISTFLFFPMFVIHWSDAELLPGILLLFTTLIVVMKLISYAHVCNDIRRKRDKVFLENHPKQVIKKKTKTKDGGELRNRKRSSQTNQEEEDVEKEADTGIPEPYSPNFQHMVYFIAAPTLIYQESYPRSERIRRRFVIRRIFEILFCLGLITFIAKQYVEPTVQNSLKWMDENDGDSLRRYFHLTERLFKLAIPNGAIWLLMFYSFFHSWLNLIGEILRFGDREFYKDWWNAESLDVFWRTWNLPVHNWLVRHIYGPALRHGPRNWTYRQRKAAAQAIVFLLSAIFHEVLVSVPTHMFKVWAFIGMFGQIPLIVLTRYIAVILQKPVWGNVMFWTSFLVFGQPAIVLLYSYDYIHKHSQSSGMM